jgi:geranylgeranyl reductase family protein
MYDVMVVGGGPAGSFAAYLLARAGLHVALAEKEQFPREKTCGGGLPDKTRRLLEGVIDPRKLPGRRITGAYLAYRNEHLVHVSSDATCYSVDRSELDMALLGAAEREGCRVYMPATAKTVVEEKDRVTVHLEGGEELTGRYLVFAEGASGRLHRQVGYAGERQTTTALQVDVFPEEVPEGLRSNTLFDFGSIPHGYAWIFPKTDRLNVGAYFRSAGHIGEREKNQLKDFLRLFDWTSSATLGKIKSCPLPYRIDYHTYNTKRTLLVGDTAGAVDSFYGEGLYYGLRSSTFGAEVIVKALDTGASLDEYTHLLRCKILRQIDYSRLLGRFFYRHKRFGYYRIARNRLLNPLYAQLIHGGTTHRKCCLRVAFVAPVIVLTGSHPRRNLSEVGLSCEAGTTTTET